MNFFAELKRRNVIRVAGLYLVGAWLLTQVASTILPMFGAPEWLPRSVVILLAIGFVPTLIFSWVFELTPEGLRRDEEVKPEQSIAPQTARRMDRMIIVVLLFALGYFAFDKFVLTARKVTAPPTVATNESATTANNKSIAVLPFANLSEEKANAYFADGIQDEILTRLSKIAELKVISRTSTQQFQSKPANIAEIAKQLGVAHLLEGSVQKSGDSVRVNVQLIKADGDSHLWAETYDRKLLDVFAVESEVAGRIASSLAATLTGREKQDLARVPTDNSDAYDAYLRGLALDNSQSDEQTEESRKHFRRAVELDPGFALAWAYLATHEAYKYFAGDRTPEQLAIARATMESATKSGPKTSESHSAAGAFYYYCLQDYDRALTEFETARQLSPSSANAIVMTAMVKRRQGDLPKSIQLQIEAAAVDPRNADIWVNLGRSYRGMRQFREAREMYDRALTILPGEESILAQKIESYLAEGDLDSAAKALAPLKVNLGRRLFNDYLDLFILRRDFAGAIAAINLHLSDEAGPEAKEFARLSRAFCQVLLGEFDAAKPALEEARRQFEERLRGDNRSKGYALSLIQINGILDDRAAVERYAEGLLKETAHDRWEAPNSEESVARGFAILRDPDRALPHLERALSQPAQDGLTVSYLRLDPIWDRIRDDPRFQKLCEEKAK